MTIAQSKDLAASLGYSIGGTKKTELITSFLSEQEVKA